MYIIVFGWVDTPRNSSNSSRMFFHLGVGSFLGFLTVFTSCMIVSSVQEKVVLPPNKWDSTISHTNRWLFTSGSSQNSHWADISLLFPSLLVLY